jgi:hypothetical protein
VRKHYFGSVTGHFALSDDRGTKRWKSAGADHDRRDERLAAWRQTIGSGFNILGKHQTRLQDYAAEKCGENKKDPRKNLKHHKKVTRKPPSIHPNFIGTCIMCKVIYLIDITSFIIV